MADKFNNPIKGEYVVELGGEKYVMRFDWAALAKIDAAFGKEPNYFNPDILAGIATIGFEKTAPELTVERIKELSPPLVPFIKDVQTALQYAYFGIDTPADTDDTEKKSGLITRLLRLLKRLFRRG